MSPVGWSDPVKPWWPVRRASQSAGCSRGLFHVIAVVHPWSPCRPVHIPHRSGLVRPLPQAKTIRIVGRLFAGLGAVLAGCAAPLSVGERGILPSPPPGETIGGNADPVLLGQRALRSIERFGTEPLPRAVATSTPPRAAGRQLPVIAGDQQVSLDYADAEITTVTRDIIVDVLHLQADIDPSVSGRMSLKTPQRVPISSVPGLLDQALQARGFALSASGSRVRVGRVEDLSVAAAAEPATQATTQGGVRTVTLRRATAADIIAALPPSATNGARVTPGSDSRTVVLSGPAAAMDGVQEMIDVLDEGAGGNRALGIYPLTNAAPTAVVRELTQTSPGWLGRGTRFAAVERLNAVLVVADSPRALAEARRLVNDLDATSAATAFVHVYPLVNRRAADLANVLASTFGSPNQSGGSSSQPAGTFGALAVGSTSNGRSGIGARVPGGSVPGGSAPGGSQRDSGAAQQPAPDVVLGSIDAASQLASAIGLSGPVRIQADAGRNALVILASASDYKILEPTIRALDVRPRQVLIEAIIAEVTIDDTLNYGLDAVFANKNNLAGQQTGKNFIGLPSMPIPTLPGLGAVGASYLFQNSNIRVVAQALNAVTTVNVISAPRVLVLDNETATLQVGDQVPLLTSQRQSSTTPDAPTINSIEMRDTGVILAVTPRIGANGNLTLDIFQEVSDAVQTSSSTIESPTIQMRRVQSSVAVQSGDTIAMGGLMRDTAQRTRSGLPWLTDIPVIGLLAGQFNNNAKRSELLLLLNPRVIEQPQQARDLTAELRAKIDTMSSELAARTVPPPSPRSLPTPPPLPRVPRGPGQYIDFGAPR